MSTRMISPLAGERKWANFWLYMDFKPLFVAYVAVYILGNVLLGFGFVKQLPALPGWLAPLTDIFNSYIGDHIWIGQNVDRYGQSYSRAARELLKFMFGMSFAMAALYNSNAAIHILLYLPRLLRSLSDVSKREYKLALSFVGVEAIGMFGLFDGLLFVNQRGRLADFGPYLLPAFFNFLTCLFLIFCVSVGRRIVVAHAQQNSNTDLSKE